ncbi:MAG: histidine kinase N-terminal 7TM domain-containing protein [Patescibacteria group bacterium]
MTNFDIYSLIVIIPTALVSSVGLVIHLGSKTLSSRAYFQFIITVVIWMVGIGVFRIASSVEIATFIVRLNYYLGTCIAASFFYFCLVFPQNKKPPKWVSVLLILSLIGFIPLFYSGILIGDVVYMGGIQQWGWGFGPLWFIFDIFFGLLSFGGLFLIYHKFRKAPPGLTKANLKFMSIGMALGFIPPTIINILLTRLGIQGFNWLGPMSLLGWVGVTSYSIMKYRQLNVKSVVGEVFIVLMMILLLINVFLDERILGIYGKLAIFVAFVFVAYLFMKSALKEGEQREQLDDLNHNLEAKVAEQTKEIRVAYEVEKKARVELEELDKTKTDFILAAQHNLRTPLTVAKGYVSEIDNSFKKGNTSDLENYLGKTTGALDTMGQLVNGLIDVTDLKVGKRGFTKEK